MRKLLYAICVILLLPGLVGCGTTDIIKKAEKAGYITEITEPKPGIQIVEFSLPDGNKYNRSAYLNIYLIEGAAVLSFASFDSDYISLDQLKNIDGSVSISSIPPAGCYKAKLNLKGNVEKDKDGNLLFTTEQREQIKTIISAMLENKEFYPAIYSNSILPSQLEERSARIIDNDIFMPLLDLCFDVSPNKAYRVIFFPGAEGYVNIAAAEIEINGDTLTVTKPNNLTIEGSFTWNDGLEQWDISPSLLKVILNASKGDYSDFHY